MLTSQLPDRKLMQRVSLEFKKYSFRTHSVKDWGGGLWSGPQKVRKKLIFVVIGYLSTYVFLKHKLHICDCNHSQILFTNVGFMEKMCNCCSS